MSSLSPWTVIFDLGGVLIDWNPRYLYRRLFNGDEVAMEHFLTHVCSPAWNHLQDGGRPFIDAEAEAIARHPHQRPLIEAWFSRFNEMIPGPIDGTVAILAELRDRNVPLYALTNWSAETYVGQPDRFDFLSWFAGIVVSGQERLTKPDPRIFRRLLDRYGIDPARAVFIDDIARNVAGAESVGLRGIQFTGAEALRQALTTMRIL
ncbi:MAG TPA: HAD family phosphatase [Rhodopila sp.]|nr:HAD family phosphatase [Rhodopila sp.]